MEIKVFKMESWLRDNQFIEFNLGQSGIEDVTVGELLKMLNVSMKGLGELSLGDNDTLGTVELRKIISSFYDNVSIDNIMVTSGSSEALLVYFMVKYKPGSNIVVLAPAFQSLSDMPRYLGYEVRNLNLKKENNFRINMDELKLLIDENTRILVLNNPHNPTGMRLTLEEIAQIKEILADTDVEVLADEHYRFLPHTDEKIIPSLTSQFDKVSAVGSMIKCFGCVGLRMGWLIADHKLIESCRDLKDYTTHTICSINDYLSQKVLQKSNELSSKYKSWILENKECFQSFVDKNSTIINWIPPEAGIVAFPYFVNPNIKAQEVLTDLIDKKNVFLLPGETFEVNSHFRICLGKEPEHFRRAMEKFQEYINENLILKNGNGVE